MRMRLSILLAFLLAFYAVPAAADEDKPSYVSIPVLNYHSITEEPGNSAEIPYYKFEEQMRYLADNGYTPLTLAEFTGMMEGTAEAPSKPILLTFDDGYADNHKYALPLLKELGFHATLFFSPGMVEDGYFLNWEQVKEFHEAGWDIQPHGMTHPYLTGLSKTDQIYQIVEAKKQIEENLGTTVDVFCYPYGVYNKTTLSILKEYGFRYAFTIQQGKTTNRQDGYKLKRIFVNGKEGLEELVNKLENW